MIKRSVFIIQEDETAVNELMNAIDTQKFQIIGSALEGNEGVDAVLRLEPELVITGLTISGIDGLGIIEKIKSALPQIQIVVLSNILTDEVVRGAMNRGATYYLVKPIGARELNRRLDELTQRSAYYERGRGIQYPSLDEKISKIFISVGIPPHIRGYSYLREGVKMAVSDPTIINSITKQLYPKISEKYETSPSKVERAIRHAIEVAWNRGRIDSINNLFGVRAYVSGEKPTNGEFIALVADKMLLDGV